MGKEVEALEVRCSFHALVGSLAGGERCSLAGRQKGNWQPYRAKDKLRSLLMGPLTLSRPFFPFSIKGIHRFLIGVKGIFKDPINVGAFTDTTL